MYLQAIKCISFSNCYKPCPWFVLNWKFKYYTLIHLGVWRYPTVLTSRSVMGIIPSVVLLGFLLNFVNLLKRASSLLSVNSDGELVSSTFRCFCPSRIKSTEALFKLSAGRWSTFIGSGSFSFFLGARNDNWRLIGMVNVFFPSTSASSQEPSDSLWDKLIKYRELIHNMVLKYKFLSYYKLCIPGVISQWYINWLVCIRTSFHKFKKYSFSELFLSIL